MKSSLPKCNKCKLALLPAQSLGILIKVWMHTSCNCKPSAMALEILPQCPANIAQHSTNLQPKTQNITQFTGNTAKQKKVT